MSLHYIYSDAVGSTQDITAYCRLYRFSAQTDAKEGSTPHSSLIVDDPDGTLNFIGHRRLYVYEDLAAASNQVVYNGYIYGQKISRGPYRTSSGRIWTLDLVDHNTLLNRRVMNGSDANRPAETDVRRMEALLGRGGFTQMTELNTVDDSLYFSGVSPVSMDAADYRTQVCGTGYVDDCAQASGKNYFVWYREAVGSNSLWYDFAESSNWSGTKRLSNVLGDVDEITTFAVDLEHEAVLDRDPSRVASGILLPYSGVAVGSNSVSGSVYVQNQNTVDTFGAIDWVAPSTNVKTEAKATARANRYLADARTEDDIVHCSVKLASQNVNDFMAGMRFDARFEHFPEPYNEFVSYRCLSRVVNEISEDSARAFRLDLELSPLGGELGTDEIIPFRAAGTIGGVTWAVPPIEGQLLVAWMGTRAGAGWGTLPAGWTAITTNLSIGADGDVLQEYPAILAYKYAVAGETQTPAFADVRSTGGGRGCFYKLSGYSSAPVLPASQKDQQSSATSLSVGPITPSAGLRAVLIGGFSSRIGEFSPANYTPGADIVEDLDWATGAPGGPDEEFYAPRVFSGHRYIESTSGSYSITATTNQSGEWCGAAVMFTA